MTRGTGIIGGFGNQLFQWAAGYSQALLRGEEFLVRECLLDRVFDLPAHKATKEDLPFRGYGQDQESLTYTRSQVREWFRFRQRSPEPSHPVVAHVRRGDYAGAGYPVISEEAYMAAAGTRDVHFVGSSNAGGMDDSLSFLPDFFTLMNARVLYRSNSTFPWWAAVLGDNEEVYSPRIDGLESGREHTEVPFEKGNHCKFAEIPPCTDLYLMP